MSREKLILVFQKDGKELRHTWEIKRGIRGSRDAKKVIKLQKKWGDPVDIIGSGSTTILLRKEYKIFKEDPEKYKGVSTIDVLKVGADITGVSPQRLKENAQRLKKKIFGR